MRLFMSCGHSIHIFANKLCWMYLFLFYQFHVCCLEFNWYHSSSWEFMLWRGILQISQENIFSLESSACVCVYVVFLGKCVKCPREEKYFTFALILIILSWKQAMLKNKGSHSYLWFLVTYKQILFLTHSFVHSFDFRPNSIYFC